MRFIFPIPYLPPHKLPNIPCWFILLYVHIFHIRQIHKYERPVVHYINFGLSYGSYFGTDNPDEV
jgi:hypothetical protein